MFSCDDESRLRTILDETLRARRVLVLSLSIYTVSTAHTDSI